MTASRPDTVPASPVDETPINDLVDLLEGGIASPPAQALYAAIRLGQREEAMSLLLAEQFGRHDAGRLYDHFRHRVKGRPLEFEEVDKSVLADMARPSYRQEQAAQGLSDRMMIRVGRDVMTGWVMDRPWGLEIMAGDDRFTPEQIDQVWRMVPKAPPEA